MTMIVDFFFTYDQSAQQRRLCAALEDGLAHGSRIAPPDPRPGQPTTLLFSTRTTTPIDCVAVYYTLDGSEPAGERGIPGSGNVVLAKHGEIEHASPLQQWHAIIPAQPDGTLVRYRADGWNAHNPQQHWYADNVDPVGMPPHNGRIFSYHVDTWHTPQWWHDAVVYHIFVDRFNAACHEPPLRNDAYITDFFGGTLNGIIEKLDYIQALGANCIWLSPIFESPSHHGYNASDYFTVARRYGSNETLRQLIDAAHQRGMRVLLDFVANHTSDQHAAFIAAREDPQSPTADWYAIGDEWPRGYRSYAGVSDMPELMTDHPDVQRYLFDVALNWLGDFGADGLRLDYVPGPSHAFWTSFQQEVKDHFPQALTLGEITGSPQEIATYAGRVDGVMDFPLAKMLRDVFAQREKPLQALLSSIEQQRATYPQGMCKATLLDNHDTHRFLWLAGGKQERLRLAAVCHMTLEGSPIVYYGTEVGLSQYGNAHKENAYARAPMLWGEQQDLTLFEHYRHLIALRHRYPALRYGQMKTVATEVIDGAEDAAQQAGAYVRQIQDEFVLVIINNHESAVTLHVNLAEALSDTQAIQALSTLYPTTDNPTITVEDGHITIQLAALSALVLASSSPA